MLRAAFASGESTGAERSANKSVPEPLPVDALVDEGPKLHLTLECGGLLTLGPVQEAGEALHGDDRSSYAIVV